MKEKLNQYKVESDSSSKVWVITEYDDSSWACSCPAWIFHKGSRVNCKHIEEIINKRKIQENIIVQEVKKEVQKQIEV